MCVKYCMFPLSTALCFCAVIKYLYLQFHYKLQYHSFQAVYVLRQLSGKYKIDCANIYTVCWNYI